MASYFLSKTAQQVDQILSDYYSKNTGNRFVLTTGNQTIAGTKTFSNQIQNSAEGNSHTAPYSYICAGVNNTIVSDSDQCIILGGESNYIVTSSRACILNGGEPSGPNTISSSSNSIILNGYLNIIDGGSECLSNGNNNTIDNGSTNCSIENGAINQIDGASYCTINNGSDNSIYGGIYNSIVNGATNTIDNAVGYSYIVGGNFNTLKSSVSVIVGGEANYIDIDCDNSLVACGSNNNISQNSNYSTILNGDLNTVNNYAPNSTIIGSKGASILPYHSGAGVWGDSQARSHASKGEHSLSLDFASGVYLRLPSFTGSKNQVGNLGELKISGAFLYICTGSNTWGRTTISTF